MQSPRSLLPGLIAILALFLFSAPAQAQDFVQSYCSSQNTGTGDAFFWQWQSNGKCRDYCAEQGTFAFAVIKYTDCWCSNYIPSRQVDVSKCQVNCPGFPDNKCGDKDENLYIYIKLNGQPSGTAGGDSTPSSTAVSSAAPVSSSKGTPSPSKIITPPSAPPSRRPSRPAQPDPITVTQTVIGEAPVITSTPSERQTSSTPSQRPSSSITPGIVTSRISASASQTEAQTSIQVITESGAVVTRTVIWQPTVDASQAVPSSSGGSNNTGAIVGGVVGGVAGIAAIVGGILFFLWRRRKQQRQQEEDGPTSITRNTSTMSKAGLISGGRGEKESHYPPTIATTHGTAASRYDNESISPVSGSHRRLSQPMMIDSRLNPDAVLMFHPALANTSRESLTSIDDSRDYGRQLNVRNPDP